MLLLGNDCLRGQSYLTAPIDPAAPGRPAAVLDVPTLLPPFVSDAAQAGRQYANAPSLLPADAGFSAPPDRWLDQVWFRSEFLSWWLKGSSAPPLVTTGPSNVLPTLDRSSTVVLFGDRLPALEHSGGRFTAGFALPSQDLDERGSSWGMEGSYFFLAQGGNSFVAASPGIPVLARPFYDISTGVPLPVVEGVANPTLAIPALSGSIAISNPTRLYGFEANVVHNWRADPERRNFVDFLCGFRYVALDEDLDILENLLAQDGTGERNIVHDGFSTRNHFYGGQVGVRGQTSFGNFFLRASGKVALGAVDQEVNITGSTVNTVPPNPPVSAVGGLLAQTTNIGRHEGTSFCVVPEVEVDAGWRFTSWLRGFVGFNFLYLSSIARPANQIDLLVNTNLVPAFAAGAPLPPLPGGPARPAFLLNRTDFWAQGINVGFEVTW